MRFSFFSKIGHGLKVFGDLTQAIRDVHEGREPSYPAIAQDLIDIAEQDLGVKVPANIEPSKIAAVIDALFDLITAIVNVFK